MQLALSTRLPARPRAQRCVCEATRPRVLDAKFWPRQAAASAQQQRRSLLELVSATVEMNDHVQRFETIAGRSAMVGFVVACGAEVLAPAHGLFGAATGEDVSVFAALALSIVCAAGVLATQNKRRLGLKLREAVTASLTALRGSMAGVQGREVDSAVDFVVDTVFSRDFIASLLTEDEYI